MICSPFFSNFADTVLPFPMILPKCTGKFWLMIVISGYHDHQPKFIKRIFWRNQPSEPLRILKLTTVTYGTASAPFLATRSLVQLAEDEQSEFPDAAKVVREDFYIDDVLSGANTESEAISLRRDLQKILAKGGFDIRKWCSNSEVILAEIPEGEREKLLQIDDANNTVKMLGLQWDTRNDQFRYFFQSVEYNVPMPITKRYVLSQISKLFDPLGFVSPVIVKAKVLMQTLWSRKLEWDETLPDNLLLQWRILYNSLRFLNQIKVPRCIIPYHADTLEVHAYGACLYLRATGAEAKCNLLVSKSKVAPLSPMTIPRKELCAAQLLVRLLMKSIPALKFPVSKIVLWSDSQIALAWLQKDPSRLDVFVRNRVAEITKYTNQFSWQYVRSADNPADLIS
ncbi:uncharacterized protein LOC128735982 [Sabethes cyaneus]|uniref:uncharacterized protein LOC128735982 n=1 Tax=Sabethes cyaneus TaxID=53552 RepID=UPI00237E7EFA|nr:uncharacterized protein LOC128735982 [Sabethes cyaneus]